MWCCAAEDATAGAELELAVPAVPAKVEKEAEKPKEEDTTPLGPGPFEVKVSKADAKLGFLFDQVDETRGVMVSEVNTGAIKSFNDSNPKQAIKAYDLVTSFEGASGTKEIAKKLQNESDLPATVTIKLIRPKIMEVILKKTDTLGVNLDYKDSAMGAVIKEVRPTGLVATWNSKDSSKAMVTGDRILEVGGKSYKGSALIEALKTVPKDAELKLTVLKY